MGPSFSRAAWSTAPRVPARLCNRIHADTSFFCGDINCFFLSQRLLLFDRKEGNSRPASHSVVREAWCEAGCGLPRALGACLSPVFLQMILEATVALSGIAHDSERTLSAFPYTPGSILCLDRLPCTPSLFSVPIGAQQTAQRSDGCFN